MDLWIRSQDRMELFNAKDIWIPNDADTSIWGQDGLKKTALGFYKTTERALEVLDEIDKLMSDAVNNGLKVARYEMPKE